MTVRDLFNHCVNSFVHHDYEAAMLMANQLVRQGTFFPINMILLLSGQHLGRPDVNEVGDQMLRADWRHPWECALMCLILGRAEPDYVLTQSKGDEQLCQANYYIGARLLTEHDLGRACEYFRASIACESECLEHVLAELELEHFERYVSIDDGMTGKPLDRRDNTLWEFDVLLDKLSSEHRPEYVYRGQVRDYATLLPSGYRPIVDMRHSPFYRREDTSLHSRGKVFRPLLSNSLWPESGRRQIDFVSLCRAHLGYPLSQLFCQHCCLPTEGLDVTEDIDIAAFFAIYDYQAGDYVSEVEQPGVMIRINVGDKSPLSMQLLKEIDFYSCPFYVSGVEILDLLGRCQTLSEARESFGTYYYKKNALELTNADWDDLRKSRPLELLALPAVEVPKSRVMMQRGGLVFPDSLLPRWFDAQPSPPPPGKTWDGPQCIEDLAQNDAVEIFFFRHHPGNRMKVMREPSAIFPAEDPIRSLLSGAVSAMAGGFPTVVLAWQDTSMFMTGDEEDLLR